MSWRNERQPILSQQVVIPHERALVKELGAHDSDEQHVEEVGHKQLAPLRSDDVDGLAVRLALMVNQRDHDGTALLERAGGGMGFVCAPPSPACSS